MKKSTVPMDCAKNRCAVIFEIPLLTLTQSALGRNTTLTFLSHAAIRHTKTTMFKSSSNNGNTKRAYDSPKAGAVTKKRRLFASDAANISAVAERHLSGSHKAATAKAQATVAGFFICEVRQPLRAPGGALVVACRALGQQCGEQAGDLHVHRHAAVSRHELGSWT